MNILESALVYFLEIFYTKKSRTFSEKTFIKKRMPKSIIYYNRSHPHQGELKIVIPTTTYFRSMYSTTNGTSQSFCYYNVNGCDEDVVLNNINNKLFDYLNECFRYSNWNSVNLLRDLPKIPMDYKMSDSDIYDYFGLTNADVDRIEDLIRWR